MRTLLVIAVIATMLGGCSTIRSGVGGNSALAPVTTKLNPDEVVRLARTCAKEHGFATDESKQSEVSLQLRPTGIVWMVILHRNTKSSDNYWITVDDTTKLTQFVEPILSVTKIENPTDDWLQSLRFALDGGRYPMTREQLMRYAGFETASPTGGGRTKTGRVYFDYELVNPDRNGGRYEVRCYVTRATESEGVPLVEAAELAYIAGGYNRFVLSRE